MTVNSVESAAPSTAFGVTDTALTTASEDKQMFLQLLVAQLKYQDPTNPADQTEFLAQTAQFTSLEKMEAVAAQTAQLVSLSSAFGAGAMVGHHVTYSDSTGNLVNGVVDSVKFGPTGPIFVVDGVEVPMPNIMSLDAKAPAATNESGTPGETTGDSTTPGSDA